VLKCVTLAGLLALTSVACGGGAGDRDTQAAEQAVPCEEREGGAGDGDTQGAALPESGARPTTEKLTGIWHNQSAEEASLLVQFGPDGTYAIDHHGELDTRPYSFGTYEVEGRTVSFVGSDGQWTWEATISEEGLLHTVSIRDSTGNVAPGTEWAWVRVSPISPAGAQITAEAASGEGVRPSDEWQLSGIWLLEGTGQLLRFSTDGTYALDAGGRLRGDPDDQGTFEVDGKGTITLTSGAISNTCAEGTSWVWKDVLVTFGAGTLRGVVTKDDGKRDLEPDMTWVRLSPS
jgi:hypothetical protein